MSNLAIMQMLERYACKSDKDCVNALREIMQSITLSALARFDFFNHAAFYGGTALRILYGLNRGSEDMDFSLLKPNNNFSLSKYKEGLENEFASFGMNVQLSEKIKITKTSIQSAFLKSNTQTQLLSIGVNQSLAKQINARSEIKLKIEIDIDPPSNFETEIKYIYSPMAFAVRSYCLPDLLSGKLHAVLFRNWKNRTKGRDWYDLVWYAALHPQYHLSHLESRARQSLNYQEEKHLTDFKVKELLLDKLDTIDIELLKEDVRQFIKNDAELDVWSKEFFRDVISRIKGI